MLKEAERSFNLRLEKDIKWANKMGIKIAGGGSGYQGPFYWVTLGPKTVLKAMTFPAKGYDTMDHPDMWGDIAESTIAPFYGITDPKTIRELKNIPYSMPRGRVVYMPKKNGGKQFVVYYGFGEEINDSQKKQIINEFDLSAQLRAGSVTFIPDDHEQMLNEDRAKLKTLLQK
jgi:hypothetical protein